MMRVVAKRFLYVVFGVCLIYLVYKSKVRPLKETPITEMDSEISSPPINQSQVQEERVAKIDETCRRYKHLLSSTPYTKGSRRAVFFTSQAYGWSYCKIGKIVSTLWTKFFYILNNEGAALQHASTGSRDYIHMSSDKDLTYGVKPELFRSSRMVISARNPYSRLFSAYIDRLYIPSMSKPLRGEDDPKCKHEYTFSEFLLQVVENTKMGMLEYHWSPIFYLCKPCEINPKNVFLQETGKTDFAYVVNQTKLEPHKLDVLYEAMHIHTNWSAFALIDDVLDTYAKINTHRSLDCLTQKEITVRLWKVFQIQGFISDDAPFPKERYRNKSDYNNSDIFRKALLDARVQYPLSTEEKDFQRQRAMNKYYRTVPRSVIDKVLEVYGVDFEMFGFSDTPPPW